MEKETKVVFSPQTQMEKMVRITFCRRAGPALAIRSRFSGEGGGMGEGRRKESEL